MPAAVNISKARIHLIVHEPGIRRTVRDLLRTIGAEDVILGKEFADIRIAITENSPDLVILGSSFPGGDVTALIRDVRHNKVGKDPFLPVISLTSEATQELVDSVAGSGSDDLLVYLLSPAQLLARIEFLIEKRKPFIVTGDYIGPDRRGADAFVEGQGEIPRIDVPNALRATVKDEMTKQEMEMAIKASLGTVNGQRLGHGGERIAWLIHRIIAGYQTETGGILEPKVSGFLTELVKLGDETTKRLPGTGFEHVGYLCETLTSVTKRMQAAGTDADETDKALLGELANAFKTAFISTDDADVSKKIRDTLSKPRSAPAGAKPRSAPAGAKPRMAATG